MEKAERAGAVYEKEKVKFIFKVKNDCVMKNKKELSLFPVKLEPPTGYAEPDFLGKKDILQAIQRRWKEVNETDFLAARNAVLRQGPYSLNEWNGSPEKVYKAILYTEFLYPTILNDADGVNLFMYWYADVIDSFSKVPYLTNIFYGYVKDRFDNLLCHARDETEARFYEGVLISLSVFFSRKCSITKEIKQIIAYLIEWQKTIPVNLLPEDEKIEIPILKRGPDGGMYLPEIPRLLEDITGAVLKKIRLHFEGRPNTKKQLLQIEDVKYKIGLILSENQYTGAEKPYLKLTRKWAKQFSKRLQVISKLEEKNSTDTGQRKSQPSKKIDSFPGLFKKESDLTTFQNFLIRRSLIERGNLKWVGDKDDLFAIFWMLYPVLKNSPERFRSVNHSDFSKLVFGYFKVTNMGQIDTFRKAATSKNKNLAKCIEGWGDVVKDLF